MGFFSWRTQDTDRSIANADSTRSTFTVVMLDDKGNKWFEQAYDGYGVFGGKDYYELLAEMNGLTGDGTEDMRMKGIELAFHGHPNGDNPEVKFPNLVEMAEGWPYDPKGPDNCEYQGFFYDDADDEDDSDWDNTLMDGLEDEENLDITLNGGIDNEDEPYISDNFQIGPNGAYEHEDKDEAEQNNFKP